MSEPEQQKESGECQKCNYALTVTSLGEDGECACGGQ